MVDSSHSMLSRHSIDSASDALAVLMPALHRKGVSPSRVVCPQGAWPTLLAFLCARFAYVAQDEWRLRMTTGSVLAADGSVLPVDAPFCCGSTVLYFRDNVQEKPLPYFETVLFQDDCLVVADKPHFLPVIPSGPYVQQTLLVRLKNRLNLPNLAPLHRIDRDTAGLVLFGVQPAQRGVYQALFRQGQIRKQYQAIAPYCAAIAAQVSPKQPLRISNRLETADNFMQMRVVQQGGGSASPVNAVTDIVAVARLQTKPDVALYTLQPLTGQRHQLRVHMMGLGVPIVGDEIYPVLLPERDISLAGHAPLQLLAQSIAFTDPITGQTRSFVSQRTLALKA
jgi:tRNA pseudouridine32 synthase / 23S rRNA pseudouridine746 synthase